MFISLVRGIISSLGLIVNLFYAMLIGSSISSQTYPTAYICIILLVVINGILVEALTVLGKPQPRTIIKSSFSLNLNKLPQQYRIFFEDLSPQELEYAVRYAAALHKASRASTYNLQLVRKRIEDLALAGTLTNAFHED